jgi:flagellar hook-associated protein 1 FlgK
MGGLFDTLTLGSRSLDTYRKAIDTTGHNLANVNTPGYTRQRVVIQSVAQDSDIGPVGGGADATAVEQLHNVFFDKQIQVENSVTGSLQARQDALQQSLSALQETINRSDASGTTTSGISQGLADFFAGMQSLSSDPSSVPERQVLIEQSQTLASRFNQVDAKLGAIADNINQTVTSEVGQVNSLARDIAKLNQSIVKEEAASDGSANDLRDARQQKIQELSKLVKIDTAEQPSGAVNVIVSGVSIVDGVDTPNTLETFDSGDGALEVRAAGQTGPLTLTGGSIEGSISTRDNDVSTVRAQVNALAQNFISEVNKIHSGGFSLTGSTGADFFTGTSAADISVNADLVGNPSLIQASSAADEIGNNDVAVALAQLGHAGQAALDGQTFSNRQAQIVAGLGQKVADAQRDLTDQKSISEYVQTQRDSVSGVSLDEEMTNLIMFQKAFEASAKLISMTDEMLNTIIQM